MENKVTVSEELLQALADNVGIVEAITLELETTLAMLDESSDFTAFNLLKTMINSSGYKTLKDNLELINSLPG